VPKVVTASDGDTLCGIAIDNGFINCQPVRDANPGADFLTRPLQDGDAVTVPDIEAREESKSTTTTNVFVKKNAPPVSICFVHGSPDRHYLDDDHLTFLLISKFQVDKGGPTGQAAFPDAFEFHAEADVDIATFKVQVVDPAAGGTVQVTLEALKPVYKADGTVDHHELFTGAAYAARKLDVQCAKVRSGVAYRSKYLRLVVDEADNNGTVGPIPPGTFPPGATGSPKPAQSLLVTDMVDQGEPDVEILDQKVRASYEIPRCTGSPKCKVVAELPIGDDRQRLRMFLHVMRATPGGAPVVSKDNARRRALKWFRRVLAQSSIGPKILGVEERDPVENMVTVSDAGSSNPPPGANAGGSSASGIDSLGNPSRMGFRMNSAGEPSMTIVPIAPVDASGTGFTPMQTANALAAAVSAPFVAVAAANPRRFNDTQGSADILITRTDGKFVTIDQIVSSDTAQTLAVASVNPLPNPQQSWDGFNFLVGSQHQRIMCRNYDTGDDRVDVFAVINMSDGAGHFDRGEAMMSGHAVNSDPTTHGVSAIKFSIFVRQTAFDGTDADPLVLSHEMLHVAAEVGHAQGVVTELMHERVTGNNDVGASKRLTDRGVQYNITNGNFPINTRLRTEAGNAGILEPW
jgi:hypothetical protein